LLPGPTETDFFERGDMLDTKLGSMSGKDDPDDVARDGFEALIAGKDQVVAGSWTNAVQSAAASVIPDRVAAAATSRMTEPGSAD
jgi:short-subunit dehydrogenase